MAGTHSNMASKGRYGDSMMAHVTPGEAVVPRHVLMQNPALAMHIVRAIHAAGGDPARYIVGASKNSHNPQTGHPEYFGNFWKHGIGKILGTAAPIALAFVPGLQPLAAAALGAGIGGITGGLKGAIRGGLTAGAGNFLGSAAAGFSAPADAVAADAAFKGATGLAGNAVETATAGTLAGSLGLGGAFNSGNIGSTLTNAGKILSPLSQIIGAVKDAGGNQMQQAQAQAQPAPQPAQAPPFNPMQPAATAMPNSLAAMASFSPEQVRSGLATKGINGGLGSDEQNYYKNLLQRSLIGDKNQVDNTNQNFLSPIEGQYWNQQGLNTSSPMHFLQGLQG